MEKRGAKAERAAGGTPKKFSTIYVENSPYFSTYFSTYVENFLDRKEFPTRLSTYFSTKGCGKLGYFYISFPHPFVEKEDVENYVENLLDDYIIKLLFCQEVFVIFLKK